ncbi:MAG TPA: SCO family protein [Candidatus Limnocylindrales bacterium]|nr:SCO family protein [Candidatus Limnocylindrales bacterium]
MFSPVARRIGVAFVALAVAMPAFAAPIAPAPLGSLDQQANVTPGPLQGVGIEQHLGQSLPLDATFVDDEGKQVRIGDYFGPDKKPAVLAMAYFECPMLCTLVLNGMIKALRPLTFSAASEFDVIVISINPKETPELARQKKAAYVENYGRKGSEGGFHFLTGEEAQIRAVADAVGFHYKFVPATGEYAHAASIYVLTSLGQLSRYFFGVEFSSRDLKLAFVEAADSKIGGLAEQLMLYCYRYDPATGKYSASILALVRLGGIATLLSLAGFIGLSRWRETHPSTSRS